MTDDTVGKFDIKPFADACEYVFVITTELERLMHLVNQILDDPGAHSSAQANVAAIQLAANRYKIGQKAQFFKIKSAQTKQVRDRLTKDALMAAYDGLLEVINTLKLAARHDSEQVRGLPNG